MELKEGVSSVPSREVVTLGVELKRTSLLAMRVTAKPKGLVV
jgi:hypothetical protein